MRQSDDPRGVAGRGLVSDQPPGPPPSPPWPGGAQPPGWVPQWPDYRAPVRPPAMDRAVWLMWTGATLALVAGVFSLLTDVGDTSSQPFGGRLSESERHSAEIVGNVVGGLFTAAIVAVWLWMAWANGKGKSWARTVSTVLAAVSAGFFVLGLVLSAVIDVDSGGSTGQRSVGIALSVLQIAVGLGAVWYMYRPESNAFYAASEPPPLLPPSPYGYPGYPAPPGYPPPYSQPRPPPTAPPTQPPNDTGAP